MAATKAALFVSGDGGRAWRPVNQQVAGLVAWPSRNDLFLIDQFGQLRRSPDGGRSFAASGSVDGQPVAFAAEGDLYVGLADSTVKRSTDGGQSWTVRGAP